MKESPLKIGTRTSALALWQAETVKKLLEANGLTCELTGIRTTGDQDLSKPIYQLGPTGVFTKALDDALLNGEVDLAVHSLKDYPTQCHAELHLAAVLERDYYYDTFIPGPHPPDFSQPLVIATGSPRRKAQWLSRYPHHRCVNLRGNIETRVERIQQSDGGIMSEAGLKRLGLSPAGAYNLHWMIPAPAQGVMAIVCRKKDSALIEILENVNHRDTWIASSIERIFMAEIEAGCAAPLGAFAQVDGKKLSFTASLLTPDGQKNLVMREQGADIKEYETIARQWAQNLLATGGKEIMEEIRRTGI